MFDPKPILQNLPNLLGDYRMINVTELDPMMGFVDCKAYLLNIT